MLLRRLITLAVSTLVSTPLAVCAQPTPPPPQPPVTAGENGFSIQSANGDYQLRLGALLNVDGRFALDDERADVISTFAIRRLRTPVRGRIARRFEFYLNPDVAGGTLVVQDAYLDTIFTPGFRVRAGKAKTPFGLERLQSVSATLFFERAFASSVAPNRDVGVQVLGDLVKGSISYMAGVMNGVADGGSGDVDTNDGKDVSARLLVRPFNARPASDPRHGLGLAIAASTGRQSGTAALPTFRTTSLQQPFFSYLGAAADGRRTRYSPQAIYTYKGFSGFAEYVHSQLPVTKGGVTADVAHRAWDVTGSFVLTGEAATDGSTGVRPRANFDYANGNWGAIQIAARYHALEVDDVARRSGFTAGGASLKAEAWTLGVNWYLTPNLRYLLNFERTVFDGQAAGARPPENGLAFRAQVSF